MNRINEIRERAENASFGKWKVYKNEDGVCIATEQVHPQLKAPIPVVGIAIRAKDPQRHIYISEANAEFIAHSHDDIFYLLDEIKRLKEELNDATAELF